MANWTGGLLTAAGRALQAKVEAGTKLELTKIKLGDGTETNSNVDDLTDLTGAKATLGISSVKAENSLCTVTGVILTSNVTAGFYAREWGLFAKDPDAGEILYMISLDPNPDYVPPSTAALKVSATYAMSIAVSNAANIAVKIDPDGLTTVDMLNAGACLVERSKAYAVGERLYTPTLTKGLQLQCTTAGTTADTMLDCSANKLGDTITDGTVVWTVVQPQLTTAATSALAGVTPAANMLPYFNSSNSATTTAISDFIKTLLDDGDAATARATLEANAQNCGGIVAASLTGNGYVKFANGLILEWGAFINNTGTQISEGVWHKTVTFPITNSGAAGSWNVWSFTNFEQNTSWVWSQGYSSENGKLLVKYQHGAGQFLIHWFIVSFT